jgi:large subunit ribosomal protein L15
LRQGLIKSPRDEVKVLVKGSLTRALTVRAHRFSAKAQEAIAGAGGKAELIDVVDKAEVVET